MITKLYRPSEALRQYVRHYWLVEFESRGLSSLQQLFPLGSVEMIVNLDSPQTIQLRGCSPHTIRSAIFAGPFTRPFQMEADSVTRCMGVSFQPWAGNLVFGRTAAHCADVIAADRDLYLGSSEIENIIEARSTPDMLEILERIILRRLSRGVVDDLSRALNRPTRIGHTCPPPQPFRSTAGTITHSKPFQTQEAA